MNSVALLAIAFEASAPIDGYFDSRRHPDYGAPIVSSILSADFNGDGHEDHAALYWYQGSSGEPASIEDSPYFVVWLGKGHDNFWQTGPHPTGKVGNWFPDTLKFDEGIVVMSGAQWGPEDSLCCPTREKSIEYEFSRGPQFGFRVGKKVRGPR